MYGISSIEHAADNSAMMIASFAIGLVALALFIIRQVKLAASGRELLNLAPFASRSFSFAIAMIMIAFGTLLGSLMIVPILLESGQGIDSLQIGIMLLPGGLAQAIASPIFGRIYDKRGPRPVLIPGAVLLAAGQWMYTTVTVQTELWMFMLCHIIFSIGLALLMTGLMSSAMASVDSAPVRPRFGNLQYRAAAGRCHRHHGLRDRDVATVKGPAGRRIRAGRGLVLWRAHLVHRRRSAGHVRHRFRLHDQGREFAR